MFLIPLSQFKILKSHWLSFYILSFIFLKSGGFIKIITLPKISCCLWKLFFYLSLRNIFILIEGVHPFCYINQSISSFVYIFKNVMNYNSGRSFYIRITINFLYKILKLVIVQITTIIFIKFSKGIFRGYHIFVHYISKISKNFMSPFN